jgi:ribosomal protein S16
VVSRTRSAGGGSEIEVLGFRNDHNNGELALEEEEEEEEGMKKAKATTTVSSLLKKKEEV